MKKPVFETLCSLRISRLCGEEKGPIYRRGAKAAEGKMLPLLLFLCALLFPARAGDLTRGTAPVDGQVLHAADLDNLIDLTTISASFVTGKPSDTTLYATDLLPLYSPTLAGYQKLQLTTLSSFLPQLVGSNAVTATTLTSTDLLVINLSYGTNSVNTAATTTNPVSASTTLSGLKTALLNASNSPPWLQPLTNANFTANVASNYYASPLPAGSLSGTPTFWTNGPLRAMVTVNWSMFLGAGNWNTTYAQDIYTNKTQSLLQCMGGIGWQQTTGTQGGTNQGSFTFFLNPGDIWSVYANNFNQQSGSFNTVLSSQQYCW